MTVAEPPPLASGVDFQALIIGPPKVGKSTLQRAIAARWAAAGAHVLAHDPCRDWQSKGAQVVRSAHAYELALRAGQVPSVASCQFPWGELCSLVGRLGDALNSESRVQFPLFVAVDEGSLLGTSGATWQGADDSQLTAMRRHRGLALCWNVQRPTMLTEAFYGLCTDVYAFRVVSPRQISVLEERCGVRPGSLSFLAALPNYRYVHMRIGEGIVSS